MRTIHYTFLLILFLVAGCKNESDLDSNGYPRVFKVALPVSNEDIPQEVFRQMEPMRLYLERELIVPVNF